MKNRTKFRYWDDKQNKMIYFDLFNVPEKINYKKLMQSSGLFDKNKKPIYEFDICKVYSRNWHTNKLEPYPSNYMLIWDKVRWQLAVSKVQGRSKTIPNRSVFMKKDPHYLVVSGIKTSLKNFENAEVIGNVFENRDLLL